MNLNLGNLSRLSRGRTLCISPNNFTDEKSKGGMATKGTGAKAARDLGPGMENLTVGDDQGERDFSACGCQRGGGAPADLDDSYRSLTLFDPAYL